MSIALARKYAAAELLLQPKQGTLTRTSDVVTYKGHPCVLTFCACTALMPVRLSQWIDGSTRPQTCDACRRKRSRLGTLPKRSDVLPFYKYRGER